MTIGTALFMGRKNDSFSQKILSHLMAHKLEVTEVYADGLGSELPASILEWEGDFIFCFRAHFIVPLVLIHRAKVAAVNFHPGPPEYRGTGCVNFALYDEVTSYGVTAHLIDEAIDSGALLDVRRFPISSADDLAAVLNATYQAGVDQAKYVIDALIKNRDESLKTLIEQSSGYNWDGPLTTKRDMEELYRIPEGVGAKELNRIIRATSIGPWRPYFLMHGKKFFLEN